MSYRYDAPPLCRDWMKRSRYSFLVNDRLGCCTIAGIAHLMQNSAMVHDEAVAFSDDDIVEAYSAVSGYRESDPSSDRGAQMIDALNHARKVGIGGRKIGAFARVDVGDMLEVQAAINLFGGIYVGASLPKRIKSQTVWTLQRNFESDVDTPGSMGGHAFISTGYDRNFLHVLPWDVPIYATVEWVKLYVDEAWAIIDERWVSGDRPAPNGFDLEKLRSNLAAIG